MKSFFLFILMIIVFSGCGYKPTATFSNQAISGKTYVSVKIDINNAANTVLIKDALIELLVNKFNIKITNDKSQANSFVIGELKSVSETQLQIDTQGYSKVYRESVTIKVDYYKLGQTRHSFTLSNYYDFTIDDDSTVTQAKKDEAIKIAISKALSDIFSKIAINTFK